MNKKTRIEEKIEERISALKIPLHNYDLFYDFKEIGKSRFGIPVYKSKWKKRNFAVVHKSLNIDTIMDDITLKRLITEVLSFISILFPNVKYTVIIYLTAIVLINYTDSTFTKSWLP
ncbi:22690_t:CDS:1 [Gigaspora margarita]|uniref:22690_t:CDS:1 n=1 Tax=Gigaspora margarita TaxID=4874 RepID=A0ABN7W0L3_GIGMA|nr:22690_t:CDS:1 [Gigaspora margarita]